MHRTGKGEDCWACSMHARFENENEIKTKFLKGTDHFVIPRSRRDDNIKMYLKTIMRMTNRLSWITLGPIDALF